MSALRHLLKHKGGKKAGEGRRVEGRERNEEGKE
jgi:hypothetical protein